MNKSNGNIISNSFKSFEGIFTGFRMFYKMTIILLIGIMILHVLIATLIVKAKPDMLLRMKYVSKGRYVVMNSQDICLLKMYSTVFIRNKLNVFKGDYEFPYTCSGTKSVMKHSTFTTVYEKYIKEKLLKPLKKNIIHLVLITSPVYLLYIIILLYLSGQFKKENKDKMLRGKKIISQEKMKNILASFDDSYKFKVNEYISIPESIVTRHSLAIGKTGSGKSQMIFPFVEQLLNRGVKTIIHDFKGDFIPCFYDPKKHIIFNPLDTRHMGADDANGRIKGWSIFNDLKEEPDLDSFVSSLIPESKNSDAFWYMAPRDILKAMLIYCIRNNKRTNNDLLKMFKYSREDLIDQFKSTEGCDIALSHLDDGKLAGQLSSVMRTFTASLRYLEGTDGNFSIEDWVKDPNPEKKVIFISNNAKVQDTLKTLITTFFDFTSRSLCSLDDDNDRRIYMILEEFGQLSKMGSVVQLLTQSRSKGGAVFILVQDFSQIEAIYGKDYSRSIINSCGNKFYFAVEDEQTAEFISRQIGSNEIERTRENKSFGVEDMKDSISLNKEIVEKRIVLPSEITSQISTFDKMSFFMQLTNMPLTTVSIKGRKYTYKCEKYIARKMLITSNENSVPAVVAPEQPEGRNILPETAISNNEKEIIDEDVVMFSEVVAVDTSDEVDDVDKKMDEAF